MSKLNKNIFETALQKTARTISSKYDVDIVFDGNTVKPATPSARGKTITLPSTVALLEEKDQKLLSGFLDHELGHVMFTDWKELEKAFKDRTDPELKMNHLFFNLLEDVAIEKKMKDMFPGTIENLDFVHKTILDRNLARNNSGEEQPEEGSFEKILNYLISFGAAEFSFDHPFFDGLNAEEKKLVEYFGDKYIKPALHNTTARSITSGKEMKEEMYQLLGKPEKEPQIVDAQEILQEVLAKPRNTDLADGKYLVYSTKHDEIKRVTTKDPVLFKEIQSMSARSVNVVRRRLIKYIQSKKNIQWESGKNSGSLNQRAYVNAFLGVSKNIFKKKVDVRTVNTVFDIMIDHSGSMEYRMNLAIQTAVALGEILSLWGVPFAVRGFTTKICPNTDFGEDPELAKVFSRFGALRIPIYKDYDDSWKNCGPTLTSAISDRGKMNTYDGESLNYSINSLIDRPEPRKILFWLNDGSPCVSGADNQEKANKFLVDVIKAGEKKVEIVAFGIGTDSVKNYFKNYVVMNDIDELAGAAMDKLSNILFGNQTKLGF